MRPFLGAALAILFATAAGSLARADEKDPNAILDKAIQAAGGEEKLKKLDAMSWKAKVSIIINGDSNDFTGSTTVQGLDHYRSEFEGKFQDNPFKGVVVLNGVSPDGAGGPSPEVVPGKSLRSAGNLLLTGLFQVTREAEGVGGWPGTNMGNSRCRPGSNQGNRGRIGKAVGRS